MSVSFFLQLRTQSAGSTFRVLSGVARWLQTPDLSDRHFAPLPSTSPLSLDSTYNFWADLPR